MGDRSARRESWLVAVYVLAVGANAALLFGVEPMFAKLALPLLGGTPSVWNTALVFFQAALLIGYAYAHVGSRWLTTKQQVALHLAVVVVSCLTLPIQLRFADRPPVGAVAIPWLVLVLTASIGLPFVVIASGAPLLQRWFAASQHRHAADPYFLYAASNLGSLGALLCYPVLIEPWFTLTTQRTSWSTLYVAVELLIIVCALWSMRRSSTVGNAAPLRMPGEVRATERVALRDRTRWVLYSAVPSSLLMGVTTFVSTDVASMPLLWVIPLALYLLSFVLVFATRPALSHHRMVRLEPFLLIPAATLLYWRGTLPGITPVIFHFSLLFVVAMVCHGELSRRRPSAHHLTEFFVWMSVGGLVGGVFNALVAPIIFRSVAEYSVAIALAAFLRPAPERTADDRVDVLRRPQGERARNLLVPMLIGFALLFGSFVRDASHGRLAVVETGLVVVAAVLMLSAADRPLRFGWSMVAVLIAGQFQMTDESRERLVRSERSFFGVYRVRDRMGDSIRDLVHGTTLHGSQSLVAARRLEPLTYYHRDGPMGDLFASLRVVQPSARRVGVIGLGVGSLACYGRRGERWTFFEIDPRVVTIARDAGLFTFLRDCPPSVTMSVGDARLSMRALPSASFDVLVLDAFSSDAVPVHLLTREAFALYARLMTPHAVLAVHISNKHVDLEPIIAALAGNMGLIARVRADLRLTTQQLADGQSPSVWVVLARTTPDLGSLATDAQWVPLRAAGDLWTDDYSNVFRVLSW